MDEKPLQLLGEVRKRGRKKNGVEIIDSEYVRNGTASIFLFTEPLGGWRHADAREHRKRKDWAEKIKWLVDDIYPYAEKIILVCDNLNTHNAASLYETYPPEEARRIVSKLEIHYTPKHGSWLDIAECELSVLGRQCLEKRRIDNLEDLNKELASRHSERNEAQKGVEWQMTTEDARTRLRHLYPIPMF